MPLFRNTSDEEAKRLLGGRFDTYLEENGDFDLQTGIYACASDAFSKGAPATQFIHDVGHAVHSAYNPSIVTLHLLERDGEKRCHNNWSKPPRMATNLGGEYLDIFRYYGLSTFNPSRLLSPEENINGLAQVVSTPLKETLKKTSKFGEIRTSHEPNG